LIDHEYKDTKLFILDFEATSFIDHSGTEMLEGLYDELQQRGIKLKAANMYGPLKDSLQKTKLEEEIVESTVSLTIEDCIEMWELETRN